MRSLWFNKRHREYRTAVIPTGSTEEILTLMTPVERNYTKIAQIWASDSLYATNQRCVDFVISFRDWVQEEMSLWMLNGVLWIIVFTQGFYPHPQLNHNIKKEYQGHKMVTIADMSYHHFNTKHKSLRMTHIIFLMILHNKQGFFSSLNEDLTYSYWKDDNSLTWAINCWIFPFIFSQSVTVLCYFSFHMFLTFLLLLRCLFLIILTSILNITQTTQLHLPSLAQLHTPLNSILLTILLFNLSFFLTGETCLSLLPQSFPLTPSLQSIFCFFHLVLLCPSPFNLSHPYPCQLLALFYPEFNLTCNIIRPNIPEFTNNLFKKPWWYLIVNLFSLFFHIINYYFSFIIIWVSRSWWIIETPLIPFPRLLRKNKRVLVFNGILSYDIPDFYCSSLKQAINDDLDGVLLISKELCILVLLFYAMELSIYLRLVDSPRGSFTYPRVMQVLVYEHATHTAVMTDRDSITEECISFIAHCDETLRPRIKTQNRGTEGRQIGECRGGNLKTRKSIDNQHRYEAMIGLSREAYKRIIYCFPPRDQDVMIESSKNRISTIKERN
ncbi:hypothetical protein VP01_2124g2 [Puccinia sorghi]|uniref:Uncharacterized protein n=1 Tax=Puccinia sorghi TaxID=27349 RepID=A0A0L6VBT1_9BASI|nr:hypothetical protein VP01_2124g2 [Puccinia sorghi]